jgi:hypothetical protein
MADLPPRDAWLASGTSLMRWRPVVDLIEVQPAKDGKVLRLRLEGIEREIALDQATADRLADLLKARAA